MATTFIATFMDPDGEMVVARIVEDNVRRGIIRVETMIRNFRDQGELFKLNINVHDKVERFKVETYVKRLVLELEHDAMASDLRHRLEVPDWVNRFLPPHSQRASA